MTLVVAWRAVEKDGQVSIGMAADRMFCVTRSRHRDGAKITPLADSGNKTFGFTAAAGLVTSSNTFTRHFAEEMREIYDRNMSLKTFEEAVRRAYMSTIRELKEVDPSTKSINSSVMIVTKFGISEVMSGGNLQWTVDSGGVAYDAVGTAGDYAIGYLDARFSDDDFDLVTHVKGLMELVPSRFADTVGCGFDIKTTTV